MQLSVLTSVNSFLAYGFSHSFSVISVKQEEEKKTRKECVYIFFKYIFMYIYMNIFCSLCCVCIVNYSLVVDMVGCFVAD